ncbi:DNA polymerase III subunit gamma/tau [Chloroflexota bacterium]
MTSQVFYRRWRPQTLAEVVGQEHVTQTLRNALSSGRISHAYLFCGPRGTGKTSTGRILAKAANCLTDGKGEPCNTCSICQSITEGRALDVIEVDAASNRGIDEIRDLREKVNYSPNEARYKVYIIDEVHMLTKEASNALLKTLEEPPPHIIFVLATTEAHKVLPTILSRCQRFDFRRISQADVVTKLSHICTSEKIKIEPEALRLIAKAATGSLRDAENLLEQLATYYGAAIELQQVQALLGVTGDWRAKELVKHIIDDNVSAGIATINSVNSDGIDLRQFNRELVAYLRGLLLVKTGSGDAIDLPAEDVAELKELAAAASMSRILKAVKLFGQLDLGLDNYSTLPLELAMVDCTMPAPGEESQGKRKLELHEPEKRDTPPAAVPKPEPAIVEPEATKETEEVVEDLKKAEKTDESLKQEAEKAPAASEEPGKQPKKPAKEVEVLAEPVSGETAEDIPATPPAAGSEIERLRLNWRQCLKDAPPNISRTPAAALLRSAKAKSIEADMIVLSFKYPLHKESMEKIENQQIAEKIISSFLGRTCHVRCVYEPEDNHLVEEVLKIGAQIIDVEEK